MKQPIIFIIPTIFFGLFWLSKFPLPDNRLLMNSQFENFKEIAIKNKSSTTYEQVTDQTGKKTWRPILTPPDNTSQLEKTRSIRANLNALKKYNKAKLTPCNHFRYLRIENRLRNRLFLGNIPSRPLAAKPRNKIRTLFFASDTSRQQNAYQKRIRTYLGLDLTPQEIIAYGENELAKSLANLANFEQTLIDQDLANSIEVFEEKYTTIYVTEKEIIAAANLRQPIIARNMPKFFYAYEIPTTNVIASLKTKRLYAIGSYRNNSFTFYWDGQTFLAKDLDYLMLHELVPGHHMQITNARMNPICKSNNTFNYANLSVFTEGWATYIETLGPELGLFRTPEQRLGKLDWDLIRAIRVILDVRIHHDSWSNAQVKAY